MRKRLIEMYHDLKESGTTSDFPKLLANTMNKLLLAKFKGVNSPWERYTVQTNLSDFKAADRVIVSESPDLLEIEESGPYKDSKLRDDKYQIQLVTKGRTFSVSRQTIINDDLQAIKRQPERFGRASARTLIKAIIDMIEGDHNAFDGKSLFHFDHSNSGNDTLANTAAGATALAAAIRVIEKSTDVETGEIMGIRAKFLLSGIDVNTVAQQLVRSTQIWPVNTTGGSPMNAVPIAAAPFSLEVLKEPFITSTTSWYVLADPEDAPVIEVGFLNGKKTPDLLIKKAEAVQVAGGGDDPWGFEFDELVYKVRHDWATALAYYQGIYRGKA